MESETVSGYGEGLWWSLGLITTLGFVNKSPVTTEGQILSAILMVADFGVLTLPRPRSSCCS